MKLLIALMLNYGIEQHFGEHYIHAFWIVVIWIIHLVYYEIIHKAKKGDHK